MLFPQKKAEFEIGKGLFENLENSKSDLPNFWKFENSKSFQMNEPRVTVATLYCTSTHQESFDSIAVKLFTASCQLISIRNLEFNDLRI